MQSIEITHEQEDALKEAVGIAVGRSAKALSELVGARVTLSVPTLRLLEPDKFDEILRESAGAQSVLVTQEFKGHFAGKFGLLFPRASVVMLQQALFEGPANSGAFTREEQESLVEIANILLNAAIGGVADLLGIRLRALLPCLILEPESNGKGWHSGLGQDDKSAIMLIETRFSVGKVHSTGLIVLTLNLNEFNTLMMVADLGALTQRLHLALSERRRSEEASRTASGTDWHINRRTAGTALHDSEIPQKFSCPPRHRLAHAGWVHRTVCRQVE